MFSNFIVTFMVKKILLILGMTNNNINDGNRAAKALPMPGISGLLGNKADATGLPTGGNGFTE